MQWGYRFIVFVFYFLLGNLNANMSTIQFWRNIFAWLKYFEISPNTDVAYVTEMINQFEP